MKLELHPLCALFPRMAGAEFEALKADIKANGLRQPITTHQGMVLDGGNRYEACLAVGAEPSFVDFPGGNLVTFVMSANFHRRHLSEGQQATIVATATDWAKAQTHGGSRKRDQEEALPLETVKQRAAVSGVSERTQKDADKLVRENPAAAKQVAAGEKSLYQAVKESKPAPTISPVSPTPAQEEYSELDAARDQIEELQAMLAVANLGSADPDERLEASNLIAELRTEVRQLRVNLKAVTTSRDSLMNELTMVKRQCVSLQAKLKKLEAVA